MSSLQKSIMKNKLPPRVPRSSGIAKLAPFGTSRRKDYSPVSWKQYFDRYVDVETEAGTFRVYLSPEPDHPSRPRIFTLHGGGYSGLSWSLFTEEITNMIHCQVVSMDIRGHGETKVSDPDDLSIETLVRDVEQVIQKLYDEEPPPIVLLGHSMGGAIAVRAAHSPVIEQYIHGLAVIDVVEGTAMESLASMQGFLRGRPTHFKSIEHAIEWCIRSGQVRNLESAKVSMPSQILNVQTGKLAINEVDTYKKEETRAPEPTRHGTHVNCIAEESDEESDTSEASDSKLAITNSLNEDNTELSRMDSTEDTKQVRTEEDGANITRSDSTDEVSRKLARMDSSDDTKLSGTGENGAKMSRMDSTNEDNKVSRTDSTNSENEDSGKLARMDSSEVAEASNAKLAKSDSTEKEQSGTFAVPNAVGDGASMKYKWRIELSRTERHWEGWFGGLSAAFLHTRAPRLLLLASVDGLDRELTVGQMQGKFQMQVLTRCGHAVHEDTPGEVARVVASFILRHRLTSPTENGEHMHLVSAPGC